MSCKQQTKSKVFLKHNFFIGLCYHPANYWQENMNELTQTLIRGYFELQSFIDNTILWGWLPLDIPAHFFVGAFFTILLIKMKFKFKQVYTTILVLALSKELWDYFFMGHTQWLESCKDILVTCGYVSILAGIRKLKERMAK